MKKNKSGDGRASPPLVEIKTNKHQIYHNRTIELIAGLLHEAGIPFNYDHINLPYPHVNYIPLWYQRDGRWHRADIAFLISKDRVALIEIYTRRIINTRQDIEGEGEIGKD